ncbi:MAG: hypothetical protein KME64_33095 [Scytonematopsis contorta HA4267-MV1]|jgi:hypothetical protein|nr:hypothetical protein [Scytonematopsis contorta HA4267-MV1]
MKTQDTAALKNILDYLPEHIKQAIEDYCKETGSSVLSVLFLLKNQLETLTELRQ